MATRRASTRCCGRFGMRRSREIIKIVAAQYVSDSEIRLRFSDHSHGVFDFTPFLEAGTPMTEPLRDPAFFRSLYLQLGALA